MKVIQVITSFDMGGAERVAINIAQSHSSDFQYYLVEVVKGHSDFTFQMKKEFQNLGITYFCSPFKNKKIALCLFWIWFIWKYLVIRPDIIHAHTEIPDLALWIFRKIVWICFWIHPEYVRTIHNTELWNDWKEIGRIVEKYYRKHCCNVAISPSTQDCYAKEYGGEMPPVIYNGLREVDQKKFGHLKSDKINVLFAGRLEYQKGIDELIAVITALKDDDRFFFHIIGDGSLKEKLYSVMRELPNVATYSKIYGLPAYLGSFDFLFMPSNYEGLGLMSIEASLAHTPTIINSCPGLKNALPSDWELSVKNNSIQEFVQIFKSIESYPYDYLCNKAYDFAVRYFSIEKMQHEYEELYKQRV